MLPQPVHRDCDPGADRGRRLAHAHLHFAAAADVEALEPVDPKGGQHPVVGLENARAVAGLPGAEVFEQIVLGCWLKFNHELFLVILDH